MLSVRGVLVVLTLAAGISAAATRVQSDDTSSSETAPLPRCTCGMALKFDKAYWISSMDGERRSLGVRLSPDGKSCIRMLCDQQWVMSGFSSQIVAGKEIAVRALSKMDKTSANRVLQASEHLRKSLAAPPAPECEAWLSEDGNRFYLARPKNVPIFDLNQCRAFDFSATSNSGSHF